VFGWPTSYNLTAAARIADTTVAAFRTRIARNLLRYIGQRPLSGAERRFSVAGIYEIALTDELERSKVVGLLFDQSPATLLVLKPNLIFGSGLALSANAISPPATAALLLPRPAWPSPFCPVRSRHQLVRAPISCT